MTRAEASIFAFAMLTACTTTREVAPPVTIVLPPPSVRARALERAILEDDDDAASHERTIIDVLRQRADQLALEGQQCV